MKISRLLYCPNCGTKLTLIFVDPISPSWEKLYHIVNCYTCQYILHSQSLVYFSINYSKIWYNNSMCGNIMWNYDRYGEEHSIWLNVISITSLLHENAKCNDFSPVCQLRTVRQDWQEHSCFLGRYPFLVEVNKCWYHFRLTWRYSPENDLYRSSFHSTEKKASIRC